MKKRFSIITWFIDSYEQIFQLAVLIVVIVLPFKFEFQAIVELKQPEMNLQQLAIYYALRHGNICIAVVLALMVVLMFHKLNKDKVLNHGNRYHCRSMFEYWIYSRILGYCKCSLVRVPISDQFKLILSDLYDDYIVGKYDEASDNENIVVRKFGSPVRRSLLVQAPLCNEENMNFATEKIYIVVSDTYPITEDMLPAKCNEHNTVIIQRTINKEDCRRYKSSALTAKVLNIVRHIDKEVTVNILPTTNVINTFDIVNEVFKTGGRDNIRHLYVFPQPHKTENDWKFSEKGTRIF